MTALNAGRVTISEDVFLRMLDYEGGRILSIVWEEDSRCIVFTLLHPDMPSVNEAQPIPRVDPFYSHDTFVVEGEQKHTAAHRIKP